MVSSQPQTRPLYPG